MILINEQTVKIRYNVTYEKSMVVRADDNEEDYEVEERIGKDMDIHIDDYTDAEVKDYGEPKIIDRGY